MWTLARTPVAGATQSHLISSHLLRGVSFSAAEPFDCERFASFSIFRRLICPPQSCCTFVVDPCVGQKNRRETKTAIDGSLRGIAGRYATCWWAVAQPDLAVGGEPRHIMAQCLYFLRVCSYPTDNLGVVQALRSGEIDCMCAKHNDAD